MIRFAGVSVTWPDDVDEILAGDLAAGFAYLTPAKGVVITPMAPLGIRDRDAGTVTLSTSLGLWKKLDRIRRNPGVAVAYHAREHGLTERPGFVLVQGRASFDPEPDREWLESITPEWDRFLGPRLGGIRGRLLNVYYWERVAITIDVERVVSWPETRGRGHARRSMGKRGRQDRSHRKPPKGGTGAARGHGEGSRARRAPPPHAPRLVRHRRHARGRARDRRTASDAGVELEVPAGTVPEGGRRAGLTSHWFQPRMVGQEQRIHTGWVEAERTARSSTPRTPRPATSCRRRRPS